MEFVKRIKLDVWISALLLVGSVILLNMVRGFPETSALFPKIILYSILILCVLVIVESFKKAEEQNTKNFPAETLKDVFAIYAFIVLYFILLRPLGFMLATLAFCVVGSWFFGNKSMIKGLFVGLAFNIFVYFAFIKFLSVPIPLMPFFI